jgi:hypothetical protein
LHGKPNKPAVDFDTGDPLQLPVESLNVFASASFILSNQDRWHEWFRGLKEVLVPLQRERVCEAGSWDPDPLGDRVRATAIRCLTLMHYRCYYCRNVFQPKK